MKQNNKQEQVQLQKSMEQDQEELKIKQQIQVLDKVTKTMYSRINEFDKINQELYKTGVKAQFYSSLTNPSTRIVSNLIPCDLSSCTR